MGGSDSSHDFLHGASGDDAIGGGEALPDSYVQHFSAGGVENGVVRTDWTRPYNRGNLLLFGADADPWNAPKPFAPRLGEFYLYDEYDPRRAVLFNPDGTKWGCAAFSNSGHVCIDNPPAPTKQFFLNLSSAAGEGYLSASSCVLTNPNGSCAAFGTIHSDGDDLIFGDLGNDWMVGGTGKDDIYAGWGNDLSNADDVLTTNGSLNDQPEQHGWYEDRVYGGAGIDILIGNTGGDRLIDWVGEWNSYLVPFSPFGIGTVSRQVEPQLPEFLYALSASDGADPTRDTDTGSHITRPGRNGEFEGELGLIIQQDHGFWQQQTGGPTDPQPGNVPGGRRDVLRGADFNNGTQDSFAVDSGVWEVKQGALSVGAASLGKDAAAVFYLDDYKPIFFEITALVKVQKPLAGWKANAYLIFDYFSPTDFKFAGIDVSLNKVVMGHRDASGWQVDVQAPFQVKPDVFYAMVVSVNGTTVSVQVDGKFAFTHTFAPRILAGDPVGLNKGFVGAGSDNSRGIWDNVTVQVLPPQLTLDSSVSFTAGDGPFGDDVAGTWTAASGRYSATAAAGVTAVSLADLGVAGLQTNSWAELQATLRASGIGGIAFDASKLDRFKFVALDVAGQRVLFGHVDRGGWVVDASAPRALAANTDYELTLTLKGTTASLLINGAFALSFGYNGATVDGPVGVLARAGTTSVDGFRIRTNDPVFAGVPRVSIGDVSVSEGTQAAPGTATLTLTLSQAAAVATSVAWRTVEGSAVAGADYVSRSGTATFAAGATTAQISVPLVGDSAGELDDTFHVVLSAPSGITIADDAGQVTIVNDDAAFTIDDATVAEGASTVTVTVRRSGPTTGSATVVAATVAGSASAGSDYVHKTQTLTFAAGASTATFVVSIVNNTLAEPVESFTVVLSSPTGGATIADGTAVVTVNDNDGALLASAAPPAGTDAGAPLTQSQLDAAVRASGADFAGVTVTVGDLPGLMLGQTIGSTITIDATAAGWGWSAMDLHTVLLHELGHARGLVHEPEGVMAATLAPGERHHSLACSRRWIARLPAARLRLPSS